MPDAAYRINPVSANTGIAEPGAALGGADMAGSTWPVLDGLATAARRSSTQAGG